MSDARRELAAISGKARNFVDEERKRRPGGRVISSIPMRASASVREAELTKALDRVPLTGSKAGEAKEPLKEVKVAFVSDVAITDDSAAGKLLASIIQAMGLQRQDAAVVALSVLPEQISALKPKAMIALGIVAAQAMLMSSEELGRLRGRFATFQGFPLMPTHHPAEILANANLKRHVWDDMKQVVAYLKADQ